MDKIPKRGEIWLINWNPARGSEQSGKRPAVVVQNDIGNEKASTTIVIAISSKVSLYPMNVLIEPPEGGLSKPSIAKTGQILTVSKQRLEKRLGVLSDQTMKAIDLAIKLSLSID
ncbi:type II toxin-antitoxin system PemK/MazF family toxin [bacterium]|nr:type II toxin-antitoxin system PemK/MazF family toxin [bacterium]